MGRPPRTTADTSGKTCRTSSAPAMVCSSRRRLSMRSRRRNSRSLQRRVLDGERQQIGHRVHQGLVVAPEGVVGWRREPGGAEHERALADRAHQLRARVGVHRRRRRRAAADAVGRHLHLARRRGRVGHERFRAGRAAARTAGRRRAPSRSSTARRDTTSVRLGVSATSRATAARTAEGSGWGMTGGTVSIILDGCPLSGCSPPACRGSICCFRGAPIASPAAS